MARAPPLQQHSIDEIIARLRHAKLRIIQAISWARAANAVWRTFNRHEGRQDVADSHASEAAHVYERSTLDAQVMMLARVFDRSGRGGAMNQNRISFPVCRELLRLPGVMDRLMDESEDWNELGVENRDRIDTRYREFLDALGALEVEQPNRLQLIRDFRDENIAHELRFDVLPQRPQYNHVHGIIDEASTLVGHLATIVSGEAIHWRDGDVGRSAAWLWNAVAHAQRRDT